jgi:hypothetical protein
MGWRRFLGSPSQTDTVRLHSFWQGVAGHHMQHSHNSEVDRQSLIEVQKYFNKYFSSFIKGFWGKNLVLLK